MSGGFFRGTSTAQDPRFADKQAKLLKSQKFAPGVQEPVDMSKVNRAVMEPWIAKRVTELLGLEDEVLINFIYGLLEGKKVDGRQVQIQLTGFMEKHTLVFMKELWALLLSAQQNVSGIPQQFLDEKAEEAKRKKMEEVQLLASIEQKRLDDESLNVEVELARQRAQEAAARLSAMFGGPPQVLSDAGNVPPPAGGSTFLLAGGTATTGPTGAANGMQGEHVAAPQVASTWGGGQEKAGVGSGPRGGAAPEVQDQAEEGSASASRVLRSAEGIPGQGQEEGGRSIRMDRRRSPARRPRPRSLSRSRSPSSSRSPPPRVRRSSDSRQPLPSSPVRRNRSPPRYGRPRGERPYARGGDLGRDRGYHEGTRDREHYGRGGGREGDRERGRDRDYYEARRDRDYYEGSRGGAREGDRESSRSFRRRSSLDDMSDDGGGTQQQQQQQQSGERLRTQGPSRPSPPHAASGRGRWTRPGHDGEGSGRRGRSSVSVSPPRSGRAQSEWRHPSSGAPSLRSSPGPYPEGRKGPVPRQRADEDVSSGDGEDGERPSRRHSQVAQQEPSSRKERAKIQAIARHGAGEGMASDAAEGGQRGTGGVQEKGDAAHLSSRPTQGSPEERGKAQGPVGKGQGPEKNGSWLGHGKRRLREEEEVERDGGEEEGEEEEEGGGGTLGAEEEFIDGQDRERHGRRTKRGEPGAAQEEGEESRREAKRVRREEKRQRKEERRRKREERKRRHEERQAGSGGQKEGTRLGDPNSGSAEDEPLPDTRGSDGGSRKAQLGGIPGPPSKAVEEELRQRAMLSLKAKRAQAHGSD